MPTPLEEYLQRIQAMPEGPEKAQALRQLSQDYEGQAVTAKGRLGQADKNAATRMPRGYSAGGQFVASSPMSTLSAGLRQGMGAYQQNKQYEKMDQLSEEMGAAREGGIRQGAEGYGGAMSGALRSMQGGTDKEDIIGDILDAEGGYVNDPADRGGETNMGISSRSYPNEDISGMTKERASELYGRDYWDELNISELPVHMRGIVMDAGVNQGVGFTREALAASGGDFGKFKQARRSRYDNIIAGDPSQERFREGWANRLNKFRDPMIARATIGY